MNPSGRQKILLENGPDGELVGRDPRKITKGEWASLGEAPDVGMTAIRGKCLDCCGSYAEVRHCTAIDCALWPLRMKSVPAGVRQLRQEEAENHVPGEIPAGLKKHKESK